MERESYPLGRGRTLVINSTPEEFPLGARGQRPVSFHLAPDEVYRIGLLKIPGVLIKGYQVVCAWDAALIVAQASGDEGLIQLVEGLLQQRLCADVPLPGLERYKTLGFPEKRRDYQAPAIIFLVRRAYGIEGDPPRAGKSLVFLGAHAILGLRRTLILCPAMVKYVWAEETVKWLDEEPVLLFGRGGDEVRVFCKTCNGRAQIDDHSKDVDEDGEAVKAPCPDCKAKNGQSMGERIYLFRELSPDTDTRWWNEEPTEEEWVTWRAKVEEGEQRWQAKLKKFEDAEAKRLAEWELKSPKRRKPFVPKDPPKRPKNTLPPDPPKGQRRGAGYCVWPPTFRCTEHPAVLSDKPYQRCPRCREEMLKQLEKASIVLCNYDILTAQKDTTLTGVEFYREDLPGWGPILASLRFEMCGADEAHRAVRRFAAKGEKKEQSRRDRVIETTADIPRVYALTGTPSMGYVRDFWGIVDFISNGLF